MSEDENRSGTGFFSLLRESGGNKSYWWLPFACLFLFLLAGGYYAVTAMRQSAHKLAGGDSYNQLSANSAIYEGRATIPKSGGFFASEEEPLADARKESAGDRMPPMKPLIDKDRGQSPAAEAQTVPAAGESSGNGADAGGGRQGAKGQPAQASMSAKLQASSSLSGTGGRASSKTSGQAGTAAFEESGAVTAVSSQQSRLNAAAPKRGGGSGVLESLKGAFRASIYGARIASADSAKGWIARSFDATPEATTTIQYEENMRSKLDVVNPNSIPQFLREQDISAGGARTLSTSKVSNPGLDKEATAAAAEKAKSDKDSTANMLSGMMGPMFGSGGLSPETDDSLSGDDEFSFMSTDDNADPKAKPDLEPVVDEFGYISYGDPNGVQVVFDSEGNLMGCTDNAAGMCLMAGAPGCP